MLTPTSTFVFDHVFDKVLDNHAKGSQQQPDEQYICFDVIKVCNLSFKIVISERNCLLYAVAKN